jgi:hypothetical protein
MNTKKENASYLDHDVPSEQQIAFLRQSSISFQLNAFQMLKEKLGDEGIEIFKDILRQGYKQTLDKAKEKSFAEIRKMAGSAEKILGFLLEIDYTTPDEFQFSITYCPYLEESKRRGMDMGFCNVFEEVEIEEISKNLAELTEPERMCRGDSKCRIKMRNTFGR